MGQSDSLVCHAAIYHVKDHRTNFESGNVDAVMDGALDGFINAYLKWKSTGAGQ